MWLGAAGAALLSSGTAAAGGGSGHLGGFGGAGYPLPADGYRLVEAELIDRRSGRVELRHQHFDERGVADRIATLGTLTLRRTGAWQSSIGVGTYGAEETDAAGFINLHSRALLREVDRDGYGLGIAGGVHYNVNDERRDDHYLVIPLTVEWGRRTTLHANIGGIHYRQADETAGLWALALDWQLARRWEVLFQFSSDTLSESKVHGVTGLRYTVLDELVQIDVGYGRELTSGGGDQYHFGLQFDAIRF
ncbi:hypothetical protein CKO15_07040 [Halorhodospira abdelmalekii]|nr:hypothetical protein [Halorhodospira abdelmalekii]